jgi:hypothetical protein
MKIFSSETTFPNKAKFYRKYLWKFVYNQKQGLPIAAMFVNASGRNEHSLSRTFHRCFLPSFGSFGQMVSEKIFLIGQSETRIAYGSHVC